MLLDIDIRDLAIIDRLRLSLAPGFNVITGETGAGKSIVIDALGLLLGGRADAGIVRAGAERATVSGVFEPGEAQARIAASLADFGVELEADEALVLGRELYAAGRSTARINGRPVPVKALAEIGWQLVDIHGQGDNASLMREAEHLGLLDRYADTVAQRRRLGQAVAELRDLDRQIRDLRADEQGLKRRADALAFAVEEIAAARLTAGEEADLLADRVRQANGARLGLLADQAYAALRGGLGGDADGGLREVSGLDLVEAAEAAVTELARTDTTLAPLAEQAIAMAEGLRELAAGLREYRERLDFSPQRLEAVEERLALIADLKRKHGAADVAAILAFAERAAAELAAIQHADERLAELDALRGRALAEVGQLAGALSAARQKAATRLARAVEAEMAALSLAGGRFQVRFDRREDPQGPAVAAPGFEPGRRYACDERGADAVAFQVSLNPGEPVRPLAKVASGGEASRLMLALKGILSAADRVSTLIFDEIDAGIGGRVGAVVGEKLWGLSRGAADGGHRHQVICVTHLPQVAAYADRHYQVAKAVEGGRTVTQVMDLDSGARVEELAQMLGATTSIARQNALQLLQQAEQWKVGRVEIAGA